MPPSLVGMGVWEDRRFLLISLSPPALFSHPESIKYPRHDPVLRYVVTKQSTRSAVTSWLEQLAPEVAQSCDSHWENRMNLTLTLTHYPNSNPNPNPKPSPNRSP